MASKKALPNFLSFSLLPIPDTCNKCGDPIDPADKITSLFNNLPKPLNAETSICNENEIQVDTEADSFSQTRKS